MVHGRSTPWRDIQIPQLAFAAPGTERCVLASIATAVLIIAVMARTAVAIVLLLSVGFAQALRDRCVRLNSDHRLIRDRNCASKLLHLHVCKWAARPAGAPAVVSQFQFQLLRAVFRL